MEYLVWILDNRKIPLFAKRDVLQENVLSKSSLDSSFRVNRQIKNQFLLLQFFNQQKKQLLQHFPVKRLF